MLSLRETQYFYGEVMIENVIIVYKCKLFVQCYDTRSLHNNNA